MGEAIHNRKKRFQARRQSAVESATAIIKAIAERRIDAYEGWQQVSGIFQSNAGLRLPELKRFVEIEGVHPNSTLSASENSAMPSGETQCIFCQSTMIDDKSRYHSLTREKANRRRMLVLWPVIKN
jgi:hypothetical protein